MLSVDLGFDHSRVVIMEVAPVDPSDEVAARYYPALVDADDVKAVTKAINGGHNGLDDRMEYLARAKAVLGIGTA